MNGNSKYPRLRDVIEESTFAEQASKITADIRRFDDAMEGIQWALAREPDIFPVVHEASNLRIAKTVAWGDLPSLRVFFTFDDNQTRLFWVEAIPLEVDDSSPPF